jgi:hypothetical protein
MEGSTGVTEPIYNAWLCTGSVHVLIGSVKTFAQAIFNFFHQLNVVGGLYSALRLNDGLWMCFRSLSFESCEHDYACCN